MVLWKTLLRGSSPTKDLYLELILKTQNSTGRELNLKVGKRLEQTPKSRYKEGKQAHDIIIRHLKYAN